VEKTNPAAADASVGHDDHQDLLDDLMAHVAPCFARRETRLTCKDMVHGLLSELEDRNCWTLAEAAGHACPYRMQHLLSRARCDDPAMLDDASDWTVEQLTGEKGGNSADAIFIVDETSDVKSGTDCAGAARQYCGATGSVALCQVTVTLTYAVPRPRRKALIRVRDPGRMNA
jgi:SRSO17 transposase